MSAAGSSTAPPTLAQRLRAGQRRALAKAITLVESTRAADRAPADALLNELLPCTGGALRVGVSGVPGVGKSTFIETFGLHVLAQGRRLAVLAVDPSSRRTGGAILGDKTRMEQLGQHPDAYIRPSPASGHLGGVAARTREAMLLCEAAGYDVILVETVGVGQSETAVAGMVDVFVLLQLPNAGDDLQAIKRGVIELADILVVNKSDLDPAAATRAQAELKSALKFLHAPLPGWEVRVLTASARTGAGVAQLWDTLRAFQDTLGPAGVIAGKRRHQAVDWLHALIEQQLRADFETHPRVRAALAEVRAAVAGGRTTPTQAAAQLLGLYHARDRARGTE